MSGTDLIVDTNIFVTARNKREAGHEECRAFLESIDRGEQRAILSSLTIAELRVGFNGAELPTVWRPMLSHLTTSVNYHIEPVTTEIAERAGEVRSETGLGLADSVLVATGILRAASGIVSHDIAIRTKQHLLPVRRLI